jgi:hypothetical protein
MLTDEELTARLSAAFERSVPELEYAGAVPRVRHRGGLAATSVLAVTAALALAPAALQHDRSADPGAVPSRTGHAPSGGHSLTRPVTHTVTHTLDLGSLHLTYATTSGQSGLFFLLGPGGVPVPPDAQKVDLGIPAQVWFASDPGPHEPQVYVEPAGSTYTYGLLGQGWTRQEFIDLLQHGSDHDGQG